MYNSRKRCKYIFLVQLYKFMSNDIFYNLFYNFQRDGCPKIVNLGSSKTDLFYERKKYGFKRR